MRIEHAAFNVADPPAMADWYCLHLGFELARKSDGSAQARFLRDPESGVMLEIYRNPPEQVPDYAGMDPLLLHLAFATNDMTADIARLTNAGAALVSDQPLDGGGRVAMLRDPWGFCLQLCHRPPGYFA
jgi:catechol 2,3-dioxygenase-like lactoylglutathione lyase family enzyme